MSADILLISITWATLYRQGISFKDHSLAYTLVRDGECVHEVSGQQVLKVGTLQEVYTSCKPSKFHCECLFLVNSRFVLS